VCFKAPRCEFNDGVTANDSPCLCSDPTPEPKVFACYEGSQFNTCYTFYKGCATCSSAAFNDNAYSPWDQTKAQEFCLSWNANSGVSAETVFALGSCPADADRYSEGWSTLHNTNTGLTTNTKQAACTDTGMTCQPSFFKTAVELIPDSACRIPAVCEFTDGQTPNTFDCRCGGVSCSKRNGYVCDSSQSLCTCDIGQYKGNDDRCQSCPVGKYSDLHGAKSIAACETCASGKIAEKIGSKVCLHCVAGREFIGINLPCRVCLGGNYQPFNNTTNAKCTKCPIGFFNSDTGEEKKRVDIKHENCEQCNITQGFVSENVGVLFCVACSSGKFTTTNYNDPCSTCPSGWKGQQKGMFNFCSKCGQGEYQNSTGKSFCFPCLPVSEFFSVIFFLLRAVAQGRDYFFNQSFIISSCASSSLPKFLNRASMVGQIAPSATTATNVRLGQRHRKSVVLPRAQRVQQDLQHQKEQEIQLASLVLRENFKRRTQRMKWFARNVKQDSSLTALTP